MTAETEKSLSISLSGKREPSLAGQTTRILTLASLALSNVLASCTTPQEVEAMITPASEPVPVTEMIPPTETQTSTSTESPTPTEAPRIDEHDLEPNFIQEISGEFMGVKIETNLTTDKSLSVSSPPIKEITLSENVALEYVARNIFWAWWYHGNVEHSRTEKPTEADFRGFMQLWSEAQKGERPWEDVQFTIFANDINDGNGYQQKEYTFWPMFDGNAPEGVRSFNQVNLVFVRSSRVDNITIYSEIFDGGFGTNIDEFVLNFYIGLIYGAPRDARHPILVNSQLVSLPWWIRNNNGRQMSNNGRDTTRMFTEQVSDLILGGLRVSPSPD